MLKKFQKTLSVGLSGLLAFGIGVTNTARAAERLPNVLHEMVPHVVLPETIQYNKTAKNLPGNGYSGVNSPYVATYVAYPSYQVPYAAEFQPVGQAVYPVSPKLLSKPLPKEESESESAKLDLEGEELAWNDVDGKDIMLSHKIAEPIRLAAGSESVIPVLPPPNSGITQTGIFCQHPASPPSAWAFSSPIFKAASVPAGWGGGQMGNISQNGPKGCSQQVGFQSVGGDPATAEAAMPQGVPHSTFQMGRGHTDQNGGTQAQILPNGMILLTMPQDHSNCGLIRCRTGNVPRTFLLPPAPNGFGIPQPGAVIPSQGAMLPAGFDMPYNNLLAASSQQQMIPQQMQGFPMTVMTPMGPAIVGYPQMPMMNPMANPMIAPQPQQTQMVMAFPNPAVASQASEMMTAATGDETLKAQALSGTTGASQVATNNPMALVMTPFGFYAVQTPADATQADIAAQMTQAQALLQSQMLTTNPYIGLYTTPFGYVAMNPMGPFGGGGMSMMNVGYQPAGMLAMGQGGMTVSDMLQIMAFINNNKPQRRAKLAERIAERRETRQATGHDPFAQLMQAWTTPYATPDTTIRMPSRNAYPYGYFGSQALPMNTANYGGYHNLYFGNSTYPGLY